MKHSMFNVAQEYHDRILLYNTLTTSVVELEKDLYNDIFENGNIAAHNSDAVVLRDMGFLIDDSIDENEELRVIRETVIDSNSGKIANIIIAPTMECNAHCYYCFENGYRKGTMSRKTAEGVIHHLKENWNGDHLGITWFGGEPLLAKDIISYICNELHKRNISFSSKIVTNGLLLENNVINLCKTDWNVNKIQVSIDAVGEEYNRIKNYGNSIHNAFNIVIDNIRKALQNNLNIKIRINFDPDNKEQAINTMQYFTDAFPGEKHLKIYFAPIDEDDCVVRNITHGFEEYDEHPYISLIKFGRENGLYRGFPDMEDEEGDEFDQHGLLKKLKIYPGVTNCYATCPSVYSIDSKGLLYKCHRLLGREEFSSGDVFAGMLHNDTYKYFCNTDPTYEECFKCKIMPICQGGCKVNAMLYHGHEACAPSKAIIKELILLYKEDLDSDMERR